MVWETGSRLNNLTFWVGPVTEFRISTQGAGEPYPRDRITPTFRRKATVVSCFDVNAFETTAVLDDASHLTLRDPLPRLAGHECRVIVIFGADGEAVVDPFAWPAGFFEAIHVADPAFVRPTQGEVPHIAALD